MTPDTPTYLFVLPWSIDQVGGVSQVVQNLALQAQRDGRLRPVVLVADWAAREPRWSEHQGIAQVRWRLPVAQPGRHGPRAWLDRWRVARFRTQFARFCSAHQVRVINCHYLSHSAPALAPVAEAADLPLIVSVHGADVTTAARSAPADLARTRQLLARCRSVVAPSHSLAERTRAELGLTRLPAVVHNGLDVQAFLASAGTFSAAEPRQARILLTVGKFEQKKGQDVLLRAFASLAADQPDLRLCMIGASADALPDLQAMSQALGCAGQVSFIVDLPHNRIAAHFRDATLFVLPSRQEPFGIVLLEAAAFGLPVVATRVGGIPEIVTDGLTGLLVPPDDVSALEAALRQTLGDPAAAAARAARLKARLEPDFSWRSAYRSYLALVGISDEPDIPAPPTD